MYVRNKCACLYRSVETAVLKRPCHAKQASAVMFPANFGGHIRYSNTYLGFQVRQQL